MSPIDDDDGGDTFIMVLLATIVGFGIFYAIIRRNLFHYNVAAGGITTTTTSTGRNGVNACDEAVNTLHFDNITDATIHNNNKQHHGVVIGGKDREFETVSLDLRHAEKTRIATCLFADNVARLSIDVFHLRCPTLFPYKQTVLASFLVSNQYSNQLRCIAFGVGTKFLSNSLYNDVNGLSGKRVRDCHAEVIARRSLLRYLYDQVERLDVHVVLGSDPLLDDELDFELDSEDISGRLRLKAGRKLHFYTSSQPCGNATWKRWAKMRREVWQDFSPLEFPSLPHKPVQVSAKTCAEGHVAVLVKADPTQINECDSNFSDAPFLCKVPPGTASVDSGRGSTMTCSDKIARWNVLGVQGGLLSHLFVPLFIESITVGRKFSRVICERALCCRLAISGLKVNHPAMLGTSVKLDDSVYGGDGNDGAVFSTSCLAWTTGDETAEILNGSSGMIESDSGFEKTSLISRSALCERMENIMINKHNRNALTAASRVFRDFVHFSKNSTYSEQKGSISYDSFKTVGDAAQYTAIKQRLLSEPGPFSSWIVGPNTPNLSFSLGVQDSLLK